MRKPDLPIFEIERPLLKTLTTQKRLVLTAPTGSGKSTQVPQMLLDSGLLRNGQVTVLQPRRLPTRMLAAWVAQARDVRLGGEVGYQMRLDNVTSPATRIRYVTEGVLLRQMLADHDLKGVSAIVFDEFHERHLYGDITLARALQIQESTRSDLIILVMSAILDVVTVQKYLDPCAVLSSQGRTYPVAIEYLAKSAGEAPVWELAVKELQRLVREHPRGDALIFMPGAHRCRTLVASMDSACPELASRPRTLGSETSGSLGGDSHAQGERRERREDIPLAGDPRRPRGGTCRDAAHRLGSHRRHGCDHRSWTTHARISSASALRADAAGRP